MREIGIPQGDKPVHVTVDGTLKSESTPKPLSDQGGSILDTALFNFNIAQQYIDETRYPVEHRLICFQHGMALLAKYGSMPSMANKLELARQYLLEVVNWPYPFALEGKKNNLEIDIERLPYFIGKAREALNLKGMKHKGLSPDEMTRMSQEESKIEKLEKNSHLQIKTCLKLKMKLGHTSNQLAG